MESSGRRGEVTTGPILSVNEFDGKRDDGC